VMCSDFEFLTAAVRNPKASKYHYVTAWGLLLQCFSKKSSGALNAGQLSARAQSHIFGGEAEFPAQAACRNFSKFGYAPSESADVAYMARSS
jgi:hypothetical protein